MAPCIPAEVSQARGIVGKTDRSKSPGNAAPKYLAQGVWIDCMEDVDAEWRPVCSRPSSMPRVLGAYSKLGLMTVLRSLQPESWSPSKHDIYVGLYIHCARYASFSFFDLRRALIF